MKSLCCAIEILLSKPSRLDVTSSCSSVGSPPSEDPKLKAVRFEPHHPPKKTTLHRNRLFFCFANYQLLKNIFSEDVIFLTEGRLIDQNQINDQGGRVCESDPNKSGADLQGRKHLHPRPGRAGGSASRDYLSDMEVI